MINFKFYMKNTTRFTKVISKIGFTKFSTLHYLDATDTMAELLSFIKDSTDDSSSIINLER